MLKAADLGQAGLRQPPRPRPTRAAAVQVMERLGADHFADAEAGAGAKASVRPLPFVKTGNADVGFVAMSQVLEGGRLKEGSMWVIPQASYDPIRQDAVLLKKGAGNEAALALLKLLQSPNIQDLIRSYGYGL